MILQHEGCMFCKYTPAVSKKELSKQLFSKEKQDFHDLEMIDRKVLFPSVIIPNNHL